MKRKQKVISVVLCLVLLLTMFSGCGGRKPEEDVMDVQEVEASDAKAEEETVQSLPEEESEEEVPSTYVPLSSGGQGRYMEGEPITLFEGNASYGNMQQTEEGIWVFSGTEAKFRSNESEDFDTVSYPQVIRESYIISAAVNDQGDMAFGCLEINEAGKSETVLRAVKKDGTVIEIDRFEPDLAGAMEFGPDGRLYVHRYGGICGIYRYELKEGEGEYLFFTTSTVEDLIFVGNDLLALDNGQVWIYDTETNTPGEQDSVLDAFCKENLTGFGGYGEGGKVACVFDSVEENVVYIACKKGIFRHVLYGSVMEQVVNGELNTLSNPATVLYGAASQQDENGNDTFLIDFYPGNLVNYVYDPDVSTVPKKMLHVYSLEESSDLRQIISLFQKTYPEWYVKYEVGLSDTGAATIEDKIKNLNTAMLGGNGPDVLLMDGLDEENYSSKGLLMDLTSLTEEMTGEDAPIPNLLEALKKEGEIYSLPVVFTIPMIAGEKKFIEGIHDLSSMTAAVEEAREDYPERVILTSILPECILGVLAQAESGNWIKDGNLDEEALREFLSCAYRLYEAENKGGSEEKKKQEEKELKDAVSRIGTGLNTRIQWIYYNFYNTSVDVIVKEKLAAIGYAGNPDDLRWIDQLPEGYDFAPLEDGRGVGFKPIMKLAVNTKSAEQEMAKEFVKLALSKQAGDLSIRSGMPFNAAAAEKKKVNTNHDSWSLNGTNEYGEEVEASASWPIQNTLTKYQKAIEAVNHVIKEDTYLTEQVIEIGAEAIQEGKTVDEAVAEIKKKTALYMAE